MLLYSCYGQNSLSGLFLNPYRHKTKAEGKILWARRWNWVIWPQYNTLTTRNRQLYWKIFTITDWKTTKDSPECLEKKKRSFSQHCPSDVICGPITLSSFILHVTFIKHAARLKTQCTPNSPYTQMHTHQRTLCQSGLVVRMKQESCFLRRWKAKESRSSL